MSVKVMTRVWEYSQAKHSELLIMLALADWSDDAGASYPSIPKLARKARLTGRQTRRALNELETIGEIHRNRSNGGRDRPNHYLIILTENPDKITLKKIQGKNYPEKNDQETLVKMSGALIRHRTVNKKESTESDKLIPDSLSTKSKRKLTRPAPDDRVKPFLTWFAEEYERRIGGPYAPKWGKDGKLIKELPPAFDLPRLKDLAVRFFESPDPWVRQNGGFTVGVFISQINKISSTGPGSNGHTKPTEVKDLDNGMVEVDGRSMDRRTYERRYGSTIN